MTAAARMPTYFIPHGAGPCFFMDWRIGPPDTWSSLRSFLESLLAALPAPPAAILMVTAHWTAPEFRLSGAAQPELIYDYGGFPAHTYALEHPAPGHPTLARRALELLGAAGLEATVDDARGWDHGVWVPMKVADPKATIPLLALSLREDMDPEAHLAAGRALAALRDENVLIIASGMSYHNIEGFGDPRLDGPAGAFDDWLTEVLARSDGAERESGLLEWAAAPGARLAHPYEDHLIPLLVATGAANDEPGGAQVWNGMIHGRPISAFRFG